MSRLHAAALALPVVFAMVALAGAGINRRDGRGPTVLTERELFMTPRSDDRSVAEVWLAWSEPVGPPGAWLTPEELAALGFDVSVAPADSDAREHYDRQLDRRAFVAFEIAGPAWDAVLAERLRAREAGDPGAPGPPRPEATGFDGARLVPVDVDGDADVLARRYPDPQQHLISSAIVGVRRFERPGAAPYIGGQVIALDPRRIQVPAEQSAALPLGRRDDGQIPIRVALMYGRRWEPWIVDVER